MCSRQNPTIFILPKNSLNKVKEGRLKKNPFKPSNRENTKMLLKANISFLCCLYFFHITLFPKDGKP